MRGARSALIVSIATFCAAWAASGRSESAAQHAVSYARDIAPIMQVNCARCHGDHDRIWWPGVDPQLNLRSYEAMMRGREGVGPVIVPGQPDESLLLSQVQSGEMPFASPKLSDTQLALIRRWILEGAKYDGEPLPTNTLVIPEVPVGDLDDVTCLPVTQSYMTLIVRDHPGGRILSVNVESAKWKPGYGEELPGRWVRWHIEKGEDWPAEVSVELQLSAVDGSASGTLFIIPFGDGFGGNASSNSFMPNPSSPPRNRYGRLQYSLSEDADVRISIAPSVGDVESIVHSVSHKNLGAGPNFENWDFRDMRGNYVSRGEYVVKIQPQRAGTTTRLANIAYLFTVNPSAVKAP